MEKQKELTEEKNKEDVKKFNSNHGVMITLSKDERELNKEVEEE